MWRIDLDSLLRASEDCSYPVSWEQIQYRGPKSPGRISHHRCAVTGDKMILVGGLKGETSNTDCWLFDLKTNAWEVAKLSGDLPQAIDDHALVQLDKQIAIFGGFAGGSRVNSVRAAAFTAPNGLAWTLLRGEERPSKTMPIERNAHTAVGQGNSLFVFGGQDEDNNKLGDLWEFNLTTKQWANIAYHNGASGVDIARSGHASVAFNGKMYIFGGILEVTKELNDLLVYDFKTQKLSVLDHNGDPNEGGYHSKIDESANKGSPNDGNSSPIHRGKTMASPARKGIPG
jgi:N-acetylneuraminic acid mutarotase